jgi:glycosyltransferase involved in cell wall biosynthesis
VVEAMALGIPVIVSNGGALPEIVRDNQNGLVVPYGKTDRLAVAMARLIKNTYLREQFSTNARKTVLSKYNQRLVAESIERVYGKAMRRKAQALSKARSSSRNR